MVITLGGEGTGGARRPVPWLFIGSVGTGKARVYVILVSSTCFARFDII
jgi:hypothetical protein